MGSQQVRLSVVAEIPGPDWWKHTVTELVHPHTLRPDGILLLLLPDSARAITNQSLPMARERQDSALQDLVA